MNFTCEENRRAIVILSGAGLSIRKIAGFVDVAKNTVMGTVKRLGSMERKFTCLRYYKCLKCGWPMGYRKEPSPAGEVLTFSCRCGYEYPQYLNLTNGKVEGGDRNRNHEKEPVIFPEKEAKMAKPDNLEPVEKISVPPKRPGPAVVAGQCSGCERPDMRLYGKKVPLCGRCTQRKRDGKPLKDEPAVLPETTIPEPLPEEKEQTPMAPAAESPKVKIMDKIRAPGLLYLEIDQELFDMLAEEEMDAADIKELITLLRAGQLAKVVKAPV